MTTAVVLSGGGSLGAVQVGMLQALMEAGVRFDLLVGTSVGAINAAWVAGDPTLDGVNDLARLWRGLARDDVFPTRPWHAVAAAAGRRRSLVPDSGLRALLVEHLKFPRLEDAAVPLHIVAADARTGRRVLLSTGPAVEAVLASTAIPGVLPPVQFDGQWLVDGGVVDNCPIGCAAELGSDTIWVLPAGYPCASDIPSTAVGMALQGLTLLVHHGLAADVARFQPHLRLRVVPPLCPGTVSPADFSHAGTLITAGHASTRAWLAASCPPTPAATLAPHAHDTQGGSEQRSRHRRSASENAR